MFQENEDISGIIHFAAYKAVGESVGKPLFYYENNMFGLINLLKCVEEFKISHFVFFVILHWFMAIPILFLLQKNSLTKKT